MPTANDEKIKNLNHALKHLTSNRVNQPDAYGESWYTGDKAQFIRRHNNAIAYLRDLLSELTQPNDGKRTTDGEVGK